MAKVENPNCCINYCVFGMRRNDAKSIKVHAEKKANMIHAEMRAKVVANCDGYGKASSEHN